MLFRSRKQSGQTYLVFFLNQHKYSFLSNGGRVCLRENVTLFVFRRAKGGLPYYLCVLLFFFMALCSMGYELGLNPQVWKTFRFQQLCMWQLEGCCSCSAARTSVASRHVHMTLQLLKPESFPNLRI